MYIEFKDLPPSSRVWFYQAERFLTDTEVERVREDLEEFVNSWTTHGSTMKGSFKIFNSKILILASDNGFQEASGCSIDSMTRQLKALGEKLNTQFFDRSIAYFKNGELKFCPFFEAKKYIANGEITEDTEVINQQVSTVEEVNKEFKIPAKDSFLKRMFVKTPLV